MVPSKCRQSIVKVSLKIVPESGLGAERAGPGVVMRKLALARMCALLFC